METSNEYISACVKAMMDSHDVAKRSQAKELAWILGISYSAATRKIKGQMPWKLEQIKDVAKHFGESVESLLGSAHTLENKISQDAILIVADRHFACVAWLGTRITGSPSTNYVGVENAGKWFIYPTCDSPKLPVFHIERIELNGRPNELEQPTIAVIDDATDTVESLCDYFNDKGLNAIPYVSLTAFKEALKNIQFDGVIIDWLFETETAANTIAKIRTSENPDAPIILLTGQLVTGKADEDDIISMIQRFDVTCMEKPIRSSILLAELTKKLGLR